MSTFKEYITASYGASVYQTTLNLKEMKKNMAKSKNQFIFLQRCVKNKIIPKSLRINCDIRNRKRRDIVHRFRFELLIATKNDAKHRFFNFVRIVKGLVYDLSQILSEEDMVAVNNITEKSREAMFIRSKEKLVNKFRLLFQVKNNVCKNISCNYVKEPVLNLVGDAVPDNHQELLNLGPKFVPNVKNIPFMDIVSITESSALKLEYNKMNGEAQNLRKDVLRILKTSRPVKDNLTHRQRVALKEIRDDKDINIYPYDKGTGFVRIKKIDAITKIREQIGDTKIITVDPTLKLARDIRNELSILNKRKRFTKKEYECLYPSDPIPPRMYGTLKSHKPEKNYPMRIVVSTIGTPSYGISKYLVSFIQHALNKNNRRLKNSETFVKEAKHWIISPNEVQVSYDVINLYPSVPLQEATTVILDILNNDKDFKKYTKLTINEIKTLIDLCLSKCYFLWNDEIHELKDSGPIGLSLMVVVAEGFLQILESKAVIDALYHQPPINILSFYRYVDDSHARFENIDLAVQFQSILNKQHQKIQYTIDTENENKELDFLDIKVINNCCGNYDFKIHRKDAITNVQIKPESCHDPSILKGIFKGFIHRAISICSDKYLNDEIDFLVNVFVENGYKENDLRKIIVEVKSKRNEENGENDNNDKNVTITSTQTISLPWIPGVSPKLRKVYRKAGYKVVFKSSKNLKTILSSKNKTTLPNNSYPGVYKIPCSCGIIPYRGETKMKISTRSIQHEDNIKKKKWDESGVTSHSKKCDGNIEFNNTETVKVIYNKFDRKVREALEIQKHGWWVFVCVRFVGG